MFFFLFFHDFFLMCYMFHALVFIYYIHIFFIYGISVFVYAVTIFIILSIVFIASVDLIALPLIIICFVTFVINVFNIQTILRDIIFEFNTAITLVSVAFDGIDCILNSLFKNYFHNLLFYLTHPYHTILQSLLV